MQIDSSAEYPVDNTIRIEVQDGQSSSATVEITLLPPSIVVEEVYSVGNSGITVGSTEDIYLQLNAIGELRDITTVQARLLKGACDSEASCTNAQVFNVSASETPLLLEETTTTT